MSFIKKRFNKAQRNISQITLNAYLKNIYESDHQVSFDRFHQTAKYVAQTCERLGFQTSIFEFPADGITVYGDWIMPLAFDVKSAYLKNSTTDEELCNFTKIPASLVVGSGATNGQQTGKLKFLKTPEEISNELKNCFVFCEFEVRPYKKKLKECGVIGILILGEFKSDDLDAHRWINAFSDHVNGWMLTADCTQIPAFSIKPSQYNSFKNKLKIGEEILLTAEVNVDFYEGTIPVVEAFLPGTTEDEFLLCGHLYEQGANDNASGTAAMLEIARQMSLQESHERGLRLLFSSEIYGTIPYAEVYNYRLDNCIAGMNIDSIARNDHQSKKTNIELPPTANCSIIEPLFEALIKETELTEYFQFEPYCLNDCLISDPQINTPCFIIGGVHKTWHTSEDTLENIDKNLFKQNTVVASAFTDIMLNIDQNESTLLEKIYFNKVRKLQKNINCENPFVEDFIQEQVNMYATTANQLGAALKILEMSYKEAGPFRRYFGPPSFDVLNEEQRQIYRLKTWAFNDDLMWVNGKRSKERLQNYSILEAGWKEKRSQKRLEELYAVDYLVDQFSIEMIISDFKAIGINDGDTVIVHSSMKKIGRLNKPSDFITALQAVIGETGTIIFPLFTNPTPNLDLRNEPTRLGLLAETFRNMPDVIRSNHGTHSVGAWGQHATEIIKDHFQTTALGINSPLHKALNYQAKILFAGVNITSCSLLHVAEVVAELPYLDISYPQFSNSYDYVDSNGKEWRYNPNQVPGDSTGFSSLLKDKQITNCFMGGRIGNAQSYVANAKQLFDFTLDTLSRHPYALLCNQCELCRKRREN
ncbi:MAG: DUF4910 domain-containing protein [Lentisphaeria bacterium]|nr:DUF4910 domain-containing protein [Lentisphaeria bacterium]